jgi:hypothetical protein
LLISRTLVFQVKKKVRTHDPDLSTFAAFGAPIAALDTITDFIRNGHTAVIRLPFWSYENAKKDYRDRVTAFYLYPGLHLYPDLVPLPVLGLDPAL